MAKDGKKKIEGGRSYTSWSTNDDEMILDILCEAIKEGTRKTLDGKIRSETWIETIKNYNEKTEANITRKNVDNRMKTWRSIYKNYSTIGRQSRWGWNFVHGHTYILDEVWEEFVKKHPECAPCKGKSCPIYDQLRTVLESNIATRASSIRPSDFRKQKENAGLNGHEDNIEEFVLMSTQIPIDLDSEAQMDSPMYTRSTTQIPSKKGKRSCPHAESQEAISLVKLLYWCKVC